MADPTNTQPGMYESAVRTMIKSAWDESQVQPGVYDTPLDNARQP